MAQNEVSPATGDAIGNAPASSARIHHACRTPSLQRFALLSTINAYVRYNPDSLRYL